jgi:O-antigen/teichoic acid export membrane protein
MQLRSFCCIFFPSKCCGTGWSEIFQSDYIHFSHAFPEGVIARSIWHKDHQIFSRTNLAAQIQTAKVYLRHPAHIAPSQLIGVAAGIMPVFIMTKAYGVAAAGMLALAWKLVALPTSLVASAIGDVYRQRIAQSYNETGQFKSIFVRTLFLTTAAAIIPFVLMYFLAPPVFVLVFGDAWREAGTYAQILAVAAFFQFIFTPVDKGAVVVGATRYIFAWHAVRMLGMLAVMAAVWTGAWSAVAAVWMIALLNIFLYVADGIIEYYLSRADN